MPETKYTASRTDADRHRRGWCRSFLRKNNIKSTAARETIVEVMAETPGHPSAEDIYMEVHRRLPAVGLTTVYRTLHVLARRGLAHKLNFGDGRARYELAEKPEGKEHHHHLVCVRCQGISDYTDFMDEEVQLVRKTEASLSRRYDFEITDHMMQFYGICPECRRAGTGNGYVENKAKDEFERERKRAGT